MSILKQLIKTPLKKITLKRQSAIITMLTICLIIFCVSFAYINNFLKSKSQNNSATIIESSNNLTSQDFNKNNSEITLQKNPYNAQKLTTNDIGVPVLYYHSVSEPAVNEVTITPQNLREQLSYIKDQGYVTLTINELTNYLLNNSPIPEKSIVITFDDGYMDNYYNAFPILKEFNMHATIFCITSKLDGSYYLSPEAIKEMSDYGLDIESHTVNHPHLDKMSYEEQLKQLKESKNTLEKITNKKVTSIAYPFGAFNNDSIKASKNAGYTLAFTTNRGFADRSDNPLRLDRIYISSKYDMNTFKEVLTKTKK